MKIGIIGSGGAAHCGAWLLDQEHQVTMLEKKNYAGGDTHTVHVSIDGKDYPVDDGAAWFSPNIYPYFNRYIELAGVAYDWIPMSLTYYNSNNGNVTLLPPVDVKRLIPIFTKSHVLPRLLALVKVIMASIPIVKEKRSQVSYREFMETMNIPEELERTFIKPLLAGLWGSPKGRTADFSLYPLVKYLYYHKPTGLGYFKMKTMVGGTEKYIKTISDLLVNTDIKLGDGVVSIVPDQAKNKLMVKTESGASFEFDKVLITAGAEATQPMLAHSPLLKQMHDALSPFEYYKALVATHSDISYMPPSRKDWSLVNITHDGHDSHSTIWHGMNTNTDIFCSYIDEGDKPKNLHYISKWQLPVETPGFFRAQQGIEPFQGQHNIFLCGAYTNDIGSHESAIVSAIKAVESIWPDSPRLKALKQA